jgi:MOSC domain-containing protein YiiM
MGEGVIVSIHVAAAGGAPMQSIASAQVVAGKGLGGDRYHDKRGTYSNHPGCGREVTLIEIEAVEALKRDHGVAIEPGQTRRNIVTRAVALNHLIGKEFTAGAVRLRGVRACDPCAHLENLTSRGVLRGLVHRGGLRAEILTDGLIRVGDPISAVSFPVK